MKRVVVVSDLHCGHFAGLTPPAWQVSEARNPALAAMQRECWKWYEAALSALQPIDWLVCNGDAIDGKGNRSGGVELITADLEEQASMATACLKTATARNHLVIYGTPYHVASDGQDYEGHIAREVGGRIGGHEWLEIEGVVFDLKHKVGGSSVPHGRHTAVARERLWNVLWSDQNMAHRSDVLIRSHVHYHTYSGGTDFLAMTTPALQGPGSTYGVRQCSGVVDFGFVEFRCEGGHYEWQAHTLRIRAARPKLIKA